MKKLLLLIACVTIFTGCTSKEEKAKELIRAEMFKTLYDYQSYEPVDYSAIDSSFTSIYSDSIIRSHSMTLIVLRELCEDHLEKAKKLGESMDIWSDSYSSYGRSKYYKAKEDWDEEINKTKLYLDMSVIQSDSLKDAIMQFKPIFEGYKLTHKFRCKTKGGNSTLGTYEYYLDPEISEILRYYDIEDENTIKIKNIISEHSSLDTEK